MKRLPLMRLIQLAAPLKWWVVLSTLLGAATIGSSIGLMSSSAFIIASAALHPPLADLQIAIVGVRFFGIGRGVLRYLERIASHQATFRLLGQLRVWFYRRIEPLAPARIFAFHSGDLLARIVADIETLEDFYTRVLAPPAVAVLVAGGTALFMARFSVAVALIHLLLLALAGVGQSLLVRVASRETARQLVHTRAELNTLVVDSVQGLAELQAFGADQHHMHLGALSETLANLQMRMARIEGLYGALHHVLITTSLIAVLIIGTPLISTGLLTGVQLTVLALAAVASYEAVTPLAAAFQHLEGSIEAGRRLFEIVDARPAVTAPEAPLLLPGHFDVEVHNLSFRYKPGAPLVLDGVSFSMPQGARVGIVGPSGAGKSTLINLLCRLWEVESGAITYAGHDLRCYHPAEVRERIAVIAQRTYLFNTTIRDNLRLADPDADGNRLAQAAHRAQLDAFIHSLPAGYDTWIGESGVRLSGGERQRLAVARALLKEAPLLLLDEPTANLDTITARLVLDAILAGAQSCTVLLITHQLAALKTFDQILVIDAGRIVERGTHKELLAQGGLYHRMWEIELESINK